MPTWPPIAEPKLRRRLGLDDAEFAEFIRGVVAGLPARECDAATVARALSYPWERPLDSYLLRGSEIEPLGAMSASERERLLARFTSPASERRPVLAIGSNAAPATLERKLAHFATAADRTVLALSGRLHGFDVGVAAQPTMYGSLPATLFPSPGTAVGAALLWVTPAQFTQLAWSEITYRLGRLRTRFDLDQGRGGFDEVLVFVSRFGAFCPEGEPVALAAIPASGRTAPELSQEQLLDHAAGLALGAGADATTLVRAIFERPAETAERIATAIHKAGLRFSSPHWTPFGLDD